MIEKFGWCINPNISTIFKCTTNNKKKVHSHFFSLLSRSPPLTLAEKKINALNDGNKFIALIPNRRLILIVLLIVDVFACRILPFFCFPTARKKLFN